MAIKIDEVGKKEKKVAKVSSAEKVAAAAPVQDEVQECGKEQGNIAFIRSLGNANDKDRVEDRVYPRIFAWEFKNVGEKPVAVPQCGINESFVRLGAKLDRMSYVDKDATVMVKPGGVFNLTPFELGVMISRPEYNGEFTGGEMPVTAIYTELKPKNKDIMSDVADRISISLKLSNGGSIKEAPIEKVVTKVETKDESGRTVSRIVVKPEYKERFGLFEVKAKRGNTGAPKAIKRGGRNPKAAAFLASVARKVK